MYRFQISAVTQPGETIALVGSAPAMGQWDVARCVRLHTSAELYPLWWVDLDLKDTAGEPPSDHPASPRATYKYIRLRSGGEGEWEAWGCDRWVPLETAPLPSPVIVEDGLFGVIPPYPYGYFAEPVERSPDPPGPEGLKIVVLGSSVALGCSAWLLQGWAWHLAQVLQQPPYGHQLINASDLGANVGSTIARFAQAVTPAQPDVVIIALSLGNEGLAASAPSQYRAIQRRFENGLQQLIRMTREVGALPILGGVYPNGGYSLEHYALLQETHQRMLTWGVPVLNWLGALDSGQGGWKADTAFDAAHPNTWGHRLMYEAIDLDLFRLTRADLTTEPHPQTAAERLIFQDNWGFYLFARPAEHSLRLINTTSHVYTLTPDWQALQTALQTARSPAGLYMAAGSSDGAVTSLFVEDDGHVDTLLTLPPNTDLQFYPVFHFFAPQRTQLLFYDGHVGLLKTRITGKDGESRDALHIINESDREYNIHPMWQYVRETLRAMPPGVYEDPAHPDAPFRTMMISQDGLESRVKAPARSAVGLVYQCPLEAINRVAILPLGDRCAVRMLLYKLEYDGPAFPFDLTRTTNLADVADMIHGGFQDMWNPAYLHYDHAAKRIYHTKWTGLSFAHEVEDSDDPVHDMAPVFERMRVRYSARSRRFWHTLEACDKALFVRTGGCDRNTVIDLVQKLEARCQGKPFRLLLLSPQPSEEFADLPRVLHYNVEFNPDRMYEDLGYWLHCTDRMREILHSLGVSSQNLFWCPP